MSKKLVVAVGAGISHCSGLGVFRGNNGMWENYKIDVVCNYLTWKSNRELVHKFYNERRQQLLEVEPNPMHYMIAGLQKNYGAIVLSQNVDDLLERAGCKPIKLHGDLKSVECENCYKVTDIGYRAWDCKNDACSCGSKKLVKPNVVLFNQCAPQYATMERYLTPFHGYLQKDDVFCLFGSSGTVISFGSYAHNLRNIVGVKTLLSNLQTETDPMGVRDNEFEIVHHGRASEVCGELERIVEGLMK